MYETIKGKEHGGKDVTKFTVEKVLKTAETGNSDTKLTGLKKHGTVNNAKTHEDGQKSKNFNKGHVKSKE